MNYSRSTITHATTGAKVWTVGFQTLEAEFDVRPAPGSTPATVHYSKGTTDGTNQVCDSLSVESTRYQKTYTDRVASISEWNGTAWVEVFKVTFNSFTSTDINYTVDIGNSSYQLHRKARG